MKTKLAAIGLSLAASFGILANSAGAISCDTEAYGSLAASDLMGETLEAVSSADMTFRISNTGRFRVTGTLNEAPGQSCIWELWSKVDLGNGQTSGLRKLAQRNSSRQTLRLSTSSLPGIRERGGEDPIINLMFRVTCGDTVITAGPVARYANCGARSTVSYGRWRNEVRRKLKRR